jgi:hypothetical protein
MNFNSRYGVESLLIFGLAVAVRLIHVDHPGYYDEFYHSLAASSMLGENSTAIQEFHYGRAPQFTWIVSLFFQLFGENLVTARLPSVLAGSASVLVLYLMARSVAGPVAGRVSALLLCFDPHAMFLSQICRFYALHGLTFMLGSLALYYVIRGPLRSWSTMTYALAAAILLVLSARLTPITSVGVAALILWAATDIKWREWHSLPAIDRGILLLLMLCAAVAAYKILPFSHISRYYQGAPIFLEDHRWAPGYYVERLLNFYPLILGLLPIAVLAGLRNFRRFTWFCAVIFGCVILVHSGAAAKQMRYIYYVMPYMYAIVGIASAVAWPGLKRLSQQILIDIPPTRWAPGSWQTALTLVLSTVVLLIAVMSNTGFRISHGMLSTTDAEWPENYIRHKPSDWEAATPLLRDIASGSDVIISSAGVKALYYLGHFDYDLMLTLTRETTTGKEFGRDYRHRRPVIASAQSLQAVISENKSGIVVIEQVHWRRRAFVPDATADFIEEHMQSVDVPEQWRLIVFRWPQDNPTQTRP